MDQLVISTYVYFINYLLINFIFIVYNIEILDQLRLWIIIRLGLGGFKNFDITHFY